MRKFLLTAAMVAATCATGFAAEWPQFLGPTRNAVSPEKGLLDRWPAEGPKVLWTADLGLGFGAAAVVDDEIYLLDRGDDQDIFRVLDLKTGQEKWKHAYDAAGRASHPGSRSTPTVDGDMVYTVGSFGDVYAFNRKTQKPVWNLNLNKAYSQAQLKWAYAQSPLIYKDTVIISPLGPDSPALIALDKKTGKVKWESEQKYGGDYYSSPVIEKVAGVEGVMILMSAGKDNNLLLFADPSTGKTHWTWNGYGCQWTIPAPTVFPDGKTIFVTGGYDAGSKLITVDKRGIEYKVTEKWSIPEGSQIHPAVLIGKHLYANINTNSTLRRDTLKTGGFACIDPATGKVVWRTGESPNFERGPFIIADGKMIILDGKIGDLVLAQISPEGYREISRVNMFQEKRGNEIWAPLALVDGLLVLRDQYQIKCVDLRGRRTALAQ